MKTRGRLSPVAIACFLVSFIACISVTGLDAYTVTDGLEAGSSGDLDPTGIVEPEPGCGSDTECKQIAGEAAPFCLLDRRQCVACRSKSDCPPDEECSPGGTCAETCVGSCEAGKACCDGLCVDTLKDVFNCGGCGTKCNAATVVNASAVVCAAGACSYGKCAGAFVDCDSKKTNGCECACGVREAVCCPSSPRCFDKTGDNCGSDNKCHLCKSTNDRCSAGSECCSGSCGAGGCKSNTSSSSGNNH